MPDTPAQDLQEAVQKPRFSYWKLMLLFVLLVISTALTVLLLVKQFDMDRWDTFYEPLYIATLIAFSQFLFAFNSMQRMRFGGAIVLTLLYGIIGPAIYITVFFLLM